MNCFAQDLLFPPREKTKFTDTFPAVWNQQEADSRPTEVSAPTLSLDPLGPVWGWPQVHGASETFGKQLKLLSRSKSFSVPFWLKLKINNITTKHTEDKPLSITDPSVCRGLQTPCTVTAKASLLLGTRCCQGRNLNACHSFNKYLLSTDEEPKDPHFCQRQAGSLGLEPHCLYH